MLIEGKNVVKTYKLGEIKVHALRGVNVAIEKGEFVAIMGPSGSGKSTLMHLVGCLDTPTKGEVWIDDVNASRMSTRQLAFLRNKKIGFVFQTFNLLARAPAITNVALPLVYGGVTRKERMQKAMSMLEKVGLGDRLYHKPNELSGGQQQRVAVARALVNDPTIILADEPTGNLDSRSGLEIMTLLQELNDTGTTLILVTHDPYVASHAKRVVRIHDGRIVKDESVHERKLARDALQSMPAEELVE